MKSSLIVGDTLDFLTTVADFPPANGWTLKFRLVPRTSGTAITLTATTSGTDYRVQVDPATTAAWTAGEYSWTSWVEKSGARYSVESGTITLLPDPGVVSAYDGRSHAAKVLDSIEAVLENRATQDQMEYQIGGRMLKRMPIGDLMRLRQLYKAEVLNENAVQNLANGVGVARIVRVRG